MYSDSDFLVHRRPEPSKPGSTKALASMLELGFVIDDRYTQLDRFGVFLFSAGERDGRNDGRVQIAL